MAQGWISIHRQLQEHWLWEDKPFSRGQAWIDLLLLANHADKTFMLGNDLVEVKAGSFITSELKLMERWGWSKTKVRAFLDVLQKDKMIAKKTDRKKTTITIENYGVFQDSETTERPQKNRKKTTERPQKNTNNNDNNVNNDNKLFIYSENPDLDKAIIEFVDFRKKIKKPMTDHAVGLMITKLNKLSPDVNTQIEIINQSILKGWTSVYPLKEDDAQQGSKRSVQGRTEVVPSWMKKKDLNNFERRSYNMDDLEGQLLNADAPKTIGTDEALNDRAEELRKRLGVI